MLQKKSFLTWLLISLSSALLTAQDFASFNDSSLLLGNGLIERKIVFEDGNICTKSLRLSGTNLNFISGEPKATGLLTSVNHSPQVLSVCVI